MSYKGIRRPGAHLACRSRPDFFDGRPWATTVLSYLFIYYYLAFYRALHAGVKRAVSISDLNATLLSPRQLTRYAHLRPLPRDVRPRFPALVREYVPRNSRGEIFIPRSRMPVSDDFGES